jgi:hypothetical protein
MSEVKKNLKRDWTVAPFMGLTLLGFVAATFDFVLLQNFSLQIFAAPGLILLIVRTYSHESEITIEEQSRI